MIRKKRKVWSQILVPEGKYMRNSEMEIGMRQEAKREIE
jgi:hypothetical protein